MAKYFIDKNEYYGIMRLIPEEEYKGGYFSKEEAVELPASLIQDFKTTWERVYAITDQIEELQRKAQGDPSCPSI